MAASQEISVTEHHHQRSFEFVSGGNQRKEFPVFGSYAVTIGTHSLPRRMHLDDVPLPASFARRRLPAGSERFIAHRAAGTLGLEVRLVHQPGIPQLPALVGSSFKPCVHPSLSFPEPRADLVSCVFAFIRPAISISLFRVVVRQVDFAPAPSMRD